MEIEDEDGSTIKLKRDGSETVFGRGSGFNTEDTTVSRHHVLFEDGKAENQTEPRVSFQVIGKNPLWLRSNGESKIKVFKKLDKGEMAPGDWFCISSQIPVWFNLKRIEVGEEKDLGIEGGNEVKSIDISQIDPVKEFGFLVIGHEFDCYPKQRIRSAKNWDWFLEETKQDSEDDDGDDEKKRKIRERKRKKGEGNDEWTGDSEEDMDTVAKMKKVDRSRYLTRSKDKNRPRKDTERKAKADSLRRKTADDEEEDDTLGGFIVNEGEEDVDEEQDGESDEEEEFIDDGEEELQLDD